jgi:hypothetical protein
MVMMNGRSRPITPKSFFERTYPYKVDVLVPPGGFGTTLDKMVAWCRQNVGGSWHVEGAHDLGERYARFYFTDGSVAVVFADTWGGIRR